MVNLGFNSNFSEVGSGDTLMLQSICSCCSSFVSSACDQKRQMLFVLAWCRFKLLTFLPSIDRRVCLELQGRCARYSEPCPCSSIDCNL
jgi:hypothetical protein